MLHWSCLLRNNGSNRNNTGCYSSHDLMELGFTLFTAALYLAWLKNPTHVAKIYLLLKGLEPAASCIRDQGATTVPARHMGRIRSLKISPIHTLIIYQIPWICCNHWIQWKFYSIEETTRITSEISSGWLFKFKRLHLQLQQILSLCLKGPVNLVVCLFLLDRYTWVG